MLELGPGTQKISVLKATGVIALLMMLFYFNNLVINGLPWSSLGTESLWRVKQLSSDDGASGQRLELSPGSPPPPLRWA